jgi:ribosomal protein S5
MISDETELDMVRRHVRRGVIQVARQHEIIAKLRGANHPTQLAEAVLLAFQSVQVEHEAHLARIT